MKGTEFRKQMMDLGITTTELSRASGLSVPTLIKIFEDEQVRTTSRQKAINAFKRLKTQLESPMLSKSLQGVTRS